MELALRVFATKQ